MSKILYSWGLALIEETNIISKNDCPECKQENIYSSSLVLLYWFYTISLQFGNNRSIWQIYHWLSAALATAASCGSSLKIDDCLPELANVLLVLKRYDICWSMNPWTKYLPPLINIVLWLGLCKAIRYRHCVKQCVMTRVVST